MVAQDYLTSPVFDILNAERAVTAVYPGVGTLTDIINFGFAYVESQDNCVAYIVTHPRMMQRILSEVRDAVLDPSRISLGKLGTADLMVSKKIYEDKIIFSNIDQSVVLFLKIKSNQIGDSQHAYV